MFFTHGFKNKKAKGWQLVLNSVTCQARVIKDPWCVCVVRLPGSHTIQIKPMENGSGPQDLLS